MRRIGTYQASGPAARLESLPVNVNVPVPVPGGPHTAAGFRVLLGGRPCLRGQLPAARAGAARATRLRPTKPTALPGALRTVGHGHGHVYEHVGENQPPSFFDWMTMRWYLPYSL